MKTPSIPTKELKFTFSKSSGPGGQNVNKVSSRVTLKWDVANSNFLTNAHKERLYKLAKNVEVEGVITINSQRFRDQSRNIADCIEKLSALIDKSSRVPKKRRPTKPTKSSIKKRLESKRKKSEVKKGRGKVSY